MRKRDDSMLVLLAQQGDREALDSLLRRIAPPLVRYIRGLLSTERIDAEDVLQETLMRIARKLPWLTDPHAFESWTYRIASREAWRALERANRRVIEEPLDEEQLAAETIEPELPGEDLGAFIGEISPASRAVLLLHYQEARPLEEIGAILSIPLGTVKSRLAYGLKRLRERGKR